MADVFDLGDKPPRAANGVVARALTREAIYQELEILRRAVAKSIAGMEADENEA
jgi:hypothetical protein